MSQTTATQDGYRIGQIAERLDLAYHTVWRLVKTGRLGHYRVGGSIRISEAHLQSYLRSVEHKPLRAVK